MDNPLPYSGAASTWLLNFWPGHVHLISFNNGCVITENATVECGSCYFSELFRRLQVHWNFFFFTHTKLRNYFSSFHIFLFLLKVKCRVKSRHVSGKKWTSFIKYSSDWEVDFFRLALIKAMPKVCGASKKKENLHFGFTHSIKRKTRIK